METYKGRCLGYINEPTAMHSFLETGYQSPLPCYHSITNNGEAEEAPPSGIPDFRSCLMLNFQQEGEDTGKNNNIQSFSHINWDYQIKSPVQ